MPADPEIEFQPSAQKKRGGQNRKDWRKIASEKISDESLRDASKRWLKEKKVVHHPLGTSSRNKKACLLAKCAECSERSKQYSFTCTLLDDHELLVEQVGGCSEKTDLRS